MREATQEEIDRIIVRAEYEKALHEDWKRRHNGLRGVSSERIALTDEEREAKIRQLNASIQISDAMKAYEVAKLRESLAAEENLRDQWDYVAFLRLMRSESLKRGTKLVENKDTIPLIKALCFRLSLNERYETELGYSFQRGLMIHGNPGLGKSYLIELIADNPVNKVQIVTMHDIIKDVLDTGDFKGLRWHTFKTICIDDIGTEYFGDNAIKRYGTDVNWLKTFIENMYSKKKEVLSRVILTTNDSAEELGKKYGFRVRDRLAEMFDVITVGGESFRRK